MSILIYYIICDCNNIFHQINVDQYGRLINILLQIYSTQLICLLRIYISFQHHDWVIHTDRLIFEKMAARFGDVTYCAVFSIPAGSTDTRSFVALALNSITARVTVTCVAQDSAPSLIAHTALVVAVSVNTAQTTHF